MPTTTLGAIYNQARAALADDRKFGGQKYTNERLKAHAQQAVRDLFRTLRNITEPHVRREVYHILPANTSMLKPSNAGITDMHSPVIVEQRGGLTSVNVTGASPQTTFLRITATSHGFSTGDRITLNQIGGISDSEGLWAITKQDANTFDANGCAATGTYTSGGVAVKSTEEFVPLDSLSRIRDAGNTSASVQAWTWREGNMWFVPSANERQLRIIYDSSATAPTKTSDSISVDDALDFLGLRTAALASQTRAPIISDRLNLKAVGPTFDVDGTPGGALRTLLIAAVRAEQRRPPEDRQRGSFREPRELFIW